MKLTVTAFVSLDGVMQGPGAPDEDRSNGFGHGGWLVPHTDEEFGHAVDDIFGRVDEFLLGRTTYDMMYPYWSQMADSDDTVARALNTLPKHVATKSASEFGWANTHPLKGDVVAAVRNLKERPGQELQVHGSHGLVQTLLAAGLVDEINLFIAPVVIGEGKRLFGEGTVPATMRLTSSRVTGNGMIVAAYRPSGPLVQQAFEVVEGEVVVV